MRSTEGKEFPDGRPDFKLEPPLVRILPDLVQNGCSGEWALSHLEFGDFWDLLPGKYNSKTVAIKSTDDRQDRAHDELYRFLVQTAAAIQKHVQPNAQRRAAGTRRRSSHSSMLSAGASTGSNSEHCCPEREPLNIRVGVVLPNGPEVCGRSILARTYGHVAVNIQLVMIKTFVIYVGDHCPFCILWEMYVRPDGA